MVPTISIQSISDWDIKKHEKVHIACCMTPLLREKITFTSQGQQITLFPLYQLDGWTIRLAAYHQDFLFLGRSGQIKMPWLIKLFKCVVSHQR